MKEQILLVEDETEMRQMIKDYLEALGFSVWDSANGLDALKIINEIEPDLVVLDIMLPGLDGLEVSRSIRKERDIPIILLTARSTEADKLIGLEIGADDYVVKPFSIRELAARIRAVLRRTNKSTESNTVLTAGDICLDTQKREVSRHGRAVQITSAQFCILKHLMTHPGRVFTRQDLMRAASDEAPGNYGYEGYERTVDVHIKNLRKVLENDSARPQYILTVWGVGYKFSESTATNDNCKIKDDAKQ